MVDRGPAGLHESLLLQGLDFPSDGSTITQHISTDGSM